MKSITFTYHGLRANGRGMPRRGPSLAAGPDRSMIPQLFLWLILASGVTPHAQAHAQATVDAPVVVSQTIRADSAGNTQVESHLTEPGASTTTLVQPDGRVVQSTWHANARLLIQIAARPVLDRNQPGAAADVSRQLDQLSLDLETLDARLHARSPSLITRRYQMLFSGVAATVDSAVISEIRRLPNVVAVYEDAEVHTNDNESGPQIGAPTVQSTYGVSGAGVKVAVIDTGIDYTHPDLGGCFGVSCKVAGGYDFVNHDNDPMDDFGHGTHVAGIIAANGVLKGIAPGATLLAYKVLNQFGSGFNSDIIAAIEQAVADGAKVANLSLGGSGNPGDPTSQAIDNATAAGMLSVVAAGNSGPSFLTVDSPGTARTALTVGAADKSWVMASFSSRGYVIAGADYLMKPEAVAPGVNILSTVPVTGQLGNASRYASLSGTSMATPHVAGSAALLLQWNAALSPQDIKNLLARGARTLGQDPFTQGAGGIDLVAAFGLPIRVSATNVSFGVVEETSGIVTRDQIVSLQNTGPSQTFTLAADSALPAGTTLELIPSSVTLQQGASANVTLRLHVDAAVTAEAPDPLDWSTRIAISSGSQTAHLPAYFFKGSVLALSFDQPPWFVTLVGESNAYRTFFNPPSPLSALVKAGMWDVVAGYTTNPFAIVAREQQSVQGHLALSVAAAEATHLVSSRAVDDTGQPLRFDHERTLLLGIPDSGTSGLPNFIIGLANFGDFRVSDLSSRYLVAFTAGGPDPSGLQFFGFGWAAKGLSSDVSVPMAGVPYRRLAVAATPTPGAALSSLNPYLGWTFKTKPGGFGSLQASSQWGELSRTMHLQWSVPPNLPILPLQKSSLTEYDAQFNLIHSQEGPYFNYKDPANIEIDGSPYFDLLDPSHQPEAVLGAGVERWDVDTPPNSLPMVLLNTSGFISANYNTNEADWMSQTMGRIGYVSSKPTTFDLYRNGVVTGTYSFFDLLLGIPSAAGAQEIRSSSAYVIGGVAGSSQVVVSFDTSKSDRNPPVVSRFRIEQNGMRTATPAYPSVNPITVKFRATDVVSLASVSLDWRPHGSTTWTPLTLGGTLPDYEAPLPQGGSIDLRVTAADSSGNTFQEQWTPALITRAPGPPGLPTLVTATRSGTGSIAVSWAASPSDVGIAGYRIERVPGNQTFMTSGTGTSFDDANGLTPGSAYFYRVIAVDTQNAVSAPSAYDVATLVQFADDPVTPGLTGIRGAHVSELRRAIDAVRHAAGLAQTWTDYTPPTGVLRASQFLELRDRLNEGRAAMSLPAVQLTDPVAAGALVRARTVKELRDGVK
jgi:subtilisin family serine protease